MNKYRSHLCSELSIDNLGEIVTLSGWVDTIRDHGNLLFIDLRDNYGITQCIIEKENSKQPRERCAKQLTATVLQSAVTAACDSSLG